ATKPRVARKYAPFLAPLQMKRDELLAHLRDYRLAMIAERTPDDSYALASRQLLEDLTVGALQREQKLLREVEAALERLEDGAFGVCEACEEKILKRRLQAIPWTRLCRECAERTQANLNN
ncbi:MAG: TraR/DksA family transcriptional regulator, partial [Terriglobia bacterium]